MARPDQLNRDGTNAGNGTHVDADQEESDHPVNV
jgi:hypothetical protein